MPAGTTYASEKDEFTDPETSRTVWRMTTCGDDNNPCYLQDMSGEQGKGSPWSEDSTEICFAMGNVSSLGSKPSGIYKMNVSTGLFTTLVEHASIFFFYPVWSRDASGEVYYMDTSGGSIRLRAVLSVSPWTQRTIASVTASGSRQKIGINADGTLAAFHCEATGGAGYKTIIANVDGSGILTGWDMAGPASVDGHFWHPTQARQGIFNRSGVNRLRDIDTLAQIHGTSLKDSHAACHPDGTRFFQIDPNNYVNLNTGVKVWNEGGQAAIHPHFAPSDAALANDARMVCDEPPFSFNNYELPALWIATPSQMQAGIGSGGGSGIWRHSGELICLHWSRSANNSSHPHPTFSPDGTKILWVSDKASHTHDNWDGTPELPGGGNDSETGGKEDLFIVPLSEDPPPPAVGTLSGRFACSGAASW